MSMRALISRSIIEFLFFSSFAVPCTFVKLQPREGMWQSTRLIEIDIGVLKYGRMQLNDLPRFDGVILCYDSLVPASYEALPNLMGESSRLTSSPEVPVPRSRTHRPAFSFSFSFSSWVSSACHPIHCRRLSYRLASTSIPRSRGG